jgi:hypothetical protein
MDQIETNQQTANTALDNAVNQGAAIVDAAQLAAQNIADVAQLAGNPEALANAVVWLTKRLEEAESIIAVLQAPAAKAAEEAVENAGEAVVHAIPQAWFAKVSALVTHAENALGFRHNPPAEVAK